MKKSTKTTLYKYALFSQNQGTRTWIGKNCCNFRQNKEIFVLVVHEKKKKINLKRAFHLTEINFMHAFSY